MNIKTPESGSAKAEHTRHKLLQAGIELFSTDGYDATSTRRVEAHAAVQRNLINYHFGNKEEFWKACVGELFERANALLVPAFRQARDIEPAERIRFLIRQFVRASAAHPQIMRVMFDEGRRNDWRLAWLVEHFTRNFYIAVSKLVAEGCETGIVAPLSTTQFYYALVSSAAIFAMAPECRLLSGEDPYADAMVDAQADAIAALLAPGSNPRSN